MNSYEKKYLEEQNQKLLNILEQEQEKIEEVLSIVKKSSANNHLSLELTLNYYTKMIKKVNQETVKAFRQEIEVNNRAALQEKTDNAAGVRSKGRPGAYTPEYKNFIVKKYMELRSVKEVVEFMNQLHKDRTIQDKQIRRILEEAGVYRRKARK